MSPRPATALAVVLAAATSAGSALPAVAAAPTRTYVQRAVGDAGSALRVDVRAGKIVRVRATLGRYRCEEVGDLGPHVVDERTSVRVAPDGRFTVRAANQTEDLTLRGRVRTRLLNGTLRVTGTIGTGDRCDSGTVSVRARRR